MHCGTGKHPGRECHGAMAQHHAGPARHHGAARGCGCGCGTHGWRRFQTQEETIGGLERYLQDLQKEAQAVEERIAAVKDA